MKWKLKQLMAQREMVTGERQTYRKIAEVTRISPNTLSALATGKAQQVGVSTIERLLDYFDCQPNDLMVIVQEKQQ